MGKGIYTYYKERLIEIGGNNKCLYLKNVSRRTAYDIGRIFEGRDSKVSELVDFLWSDGRYPLPLINMDEKEEILRNLDMPQAKKSAKAEKTDAEAQRFQIAEEIVKLKELKREIDEIERETGRFELYLGYPFVFGCIPQGSTKTFIKAPLLLFPVKIDIIDDLTCEIRLNTAEKVHITHALIYAYAQSKRINVDGIDLEFSDIASRFGSVKGVIDYLLSEHIKIDCTNSKNVYNYGRFKEPEARPYLSVRYAAVMGRFPLSNSIYNDYTLLEKQKLSNDAVNELLRTKGFKLKKPKKSKQKSARSTNSYIVKMLDYAQSEVVKKVGEKGNMVIYGPPGTGKSQTIVNVITDAICKNKSVLVVSQKKAALDVVYNRLGVLAEKAMYIIDEGKEKRAFYERCLNAHQRDMLESLADVSALESEYSELEKKIRAEEHSLDLIFDTLNSKRPFGLSLSEMYAHSTNLSKSSLDYGIYEKLTECKSIMDMNYNTLREALFGIRSMNLAKLYYDFIEDKEKNPLIDNMQEDLDIRTLAEVKARLEEIQKSKKGLFNTAKHPYYRQVLAYYYELKNEDSLDDIVKLQRRFKAPKRLLFTGAVEKQIKSEFLGTMEAIEQFVKEYDCLHRVLTADGYLSVIDNILRGNTSYIKLVHEALDNYISLRDVNKLLASLDSNKLAVLNFAYTTCKTYSGYIDIIDKLLELRIYHEVLRYESECTEELARLLDYSNITERIYKLKEKQLDVAYRLCRGKNSREYENLYENAKNNKDYLYQISKKQKFWPIRKTMEVYSDFILSLIPCWLLSPENVSNLLPLVKNLFDIVIFDEASQVFIESTIPTIYRGSSIVVAGDDKQLRPSATFMKRYLGTDPSGIDDYSVQAALEVDSLLDLARARYESANLNYHYRSKYQELIAFSNAAFYSSMLQVAPNIEKNSNERPIERYKVSGRWIDRKNTEEAKQVVKLLYDILKTRKNNESIGIITFNSEQQSHISDMIDKEASKNAEFRSLLHKETHRSENGEDTGLFVKNLENVQGDERDIIIFSVGYAENEEGKVYTSFGSLSAEGGENRLNVAVTRAKSKIIVVTSIEPEELKVDTAKNKGPKLLQKYLMYVRAVSSADKEQTDKSLSELSPTEAGGDTLITTLADVEEQIKECLEKLGYTVDTKLGGKNNRISLAVYDKDTDRYLVGVELDKDAFASSLSTMERDVYKPRFLKERGWNIMRVWCRDFWLSPTKVVRSIANAAEKAKKKEKM